MKSQMIVKSNIFDEIGNYPWGVL